LRHEWADSAYRGLVAFAWVMFELALAIVSRREGVEGFEVQLRRCRLNRNYEHTLKSSKVAVQVALIGVITRRLAKTNRRQSY
jgi:hypothetical protein